jgi:hypothetical protein
VQCKDFSIAQQVTVQKSQGYSVAQITDSSPEEFETGDAMLSAGKNTGANILPPRTTSRKYTFHANSKGFSTSSDLSAAQYARTAEDSQGRVYESHLQLTSCLSLCIVHSLSSPKHLSMLSMILEEWNTAVHV